LKKPLDRSPRHRTRLLTGNIRRGIHLCKCGKLTANALRSPFSLSTVAMDGGLCERIGISRFTAEVPEISTPKSHQPNRGIIITDTNISIITNNRNNVHSFLSFPHNFRTVTIPRRHCQYPYRRQFPLPSPSQSISCTMTAPLHFLQYAPPPPKTTTVVPLLPQN